MVRSRSVGVGDKAVEYEVESSLWLRLRPDGLPDFTLSGSLEHYQGDYRSDNEKSLERAWDISGELDFSKFWPEVLDSEKEGLNLVFRLEGDSAYEKSEYEAQKESNLDYFIGFQLDLKLSE